MTCAASWCATKSPRTASLTEGTNDWFAQAKDGTVWYCGEETAEFETFDGRPPDEAGAGQHRRLVQGGSRRRQAGHHLPGEPAAEPDLYRRVVARQRRRRHARDRRRLLVRQVSRTSTSWCRRDSRGCSVRAIASSPATRRRSSRGNSSASTTRPASACSWKRRRKPGRSIAS